MNDRMKRTVAAVAALGALALGGSALAQAGNSTPVSQAPVAAESTVGPDTDNVQEGDQSGSDKADAPGEESENSAGPDTDNVQEGDQSGSDKADAPGEESGSEAPGDDGPGGHADEAVQ